MSRQSKRLTCSLSLKGIDLLRTSKRPALLAAAFGLILAGGLAGAPSSAEANPEKVFRGQILTSKKAFPTKAKSKRAYTKKLKKLRTTRFKEDTETKSWKIHYAAFFRKPLNDLEVTVKLYDVTGGKKKLINSYEQYLDRRGERSVISNITLEREFFGVNRKIMMVMENRKYILAMAKFWIVGEGEKYSGEVDFTKDDSKSDDKKKKK